MQHAPLQNTLTDAPLKTQTMERDKLIAKQLTKNKLPPASPPTQMEYDLSEPKNSDSYSKSTMVNIKPVRLSHPSEHSVDVMDCAKAAQKNYHYEIIPALDNCPASSTLENNLHSTPTPTSAYHKDGHYFLKLLASEKSRLMTLADEAERDMCMLTTTSGNIEISDEIFGILRAVSGKTKLLVSQKFKQFEGLCHSNLNPTANEKFPTTIEDLLGFWDMVNLQIEHIDSLFQELDLIKSNNWQPTKDITAPFVPTGSKLMKKPVLKNGNNNNIIAPNKLSQNAQLMAQKRDTQRKQLIEMKRRNKIAAVDKGLVSSPIEIYVSENF